MFTESLEFKLAENRLQHLESELDHVMAAHYEAKACQQCERLIAVCVVVHKSISAAERTILAADREGIQEYTDSQFDSIKKVYERWLAFATVLASEADKFAQSGYDVERLKQFRECCDEVNDWLERNKWHESAQALLCERFAREEADEVASAGRDLAT